MLKIDFLISKIICIFYIKYSIFLISINQNLNIKNRKIIFIYPNRCLVKKANGPDHTARLIYKNGQTFYFIIMIDITTEICSYKLNTCSQNGPTLFSRSRSIDINFKKKKGPTLQKKKKNRFSSGHYKAEILIELLIFLSRSDWEGKGPCAVVPLT